MAVHQPRFVVAARFLSAMFRLLLRPILLLTLLAALPIFAIRAQPYDDSELRAFLTPPEGCPAPCFMGIRPGVTTIEEAVAILEAHEWVTAIDEHYVELMRLAAAYEPPSLKTLLSWEWSTSKPAWVDSRRNSSLIIKSRRIEGVMIQTTIPLGDVLVTYGKPVSSKLLWTKNNFFRYSFAYDKWYPAYCMRIDADRIVTPGQVMRPPVSMPFQRISFLNAHATMSLYTNCEQ
jgi:hypothetical protein